MYMYSINIELFRAGLLKYEAFVFPPASLSFEKVWYWGYLGVFLYPRPSNASQVQAWEKYGGWKDFVKATLTKVKPTAPHQESTSNAVTLQK